MFFVMRYKFAATLLWQKFCLEFQRDSVA